MKITNSVDIMDGKIIARRMMILLIGNRCDVEDNNIIEADDDDIINWRQ